MCLVRPLRYSVSYVQDRAILLVCFVLVDNNLFAHECAEALTIQFWWDARDLVFLSLLHVDFVEILSHLLNVVSLKVVYDCNMVDVPAVIGDKFVSGTFILLQELLNKFAYKRA